MSMDYLVEDDDAPAVPLIPVRADSLANAVKDLPARTVEWVEATGYGAKPGTVLLLPGNEGEPVGGALVGVEGEKDIWSWGGAALALPPGKYRIEASSSANSASRAALGWVLGAYAFTRYKETGRPARNLVWPQSAARPYVAAAAPATGFVRDLINTPAADMG
ncbi:MAG: leucyl aminopeptidase family protein, partial [Proteobacteria bacterium]|nr:leucyl aminopeptidase family protein [Pseudomonadota bacterium]